MRKNYLYKVNFEQKTFDIEGYDDITKKNVNVLANNDSLTATNITKRYRDKVYFTIMDSYLVNGQIYYLYSNNILYRYQEKNNIFYYTFVCQSKPILTSVVVNSQNYVLVIEDGRTSVIGQSVDVGTAVYGDVATSYKGKCFVGKDKCVYVSHPIDTSTGTMNVSPNNVITLDDDAGKVIDFACFDDHLLIVCENALYKLQTDYSEDYSLERLKVGLIKVTPKSLAMVNDKLYFIANEKICCYYDGVIKTENTAYDNYLGTFFDKAQANEQYYMFQIIVDASEYMLLFDVITNQCFLLATSGENLVGKRYTFQAENGYYRIIDDSAYLQGEWTSKSLTFKSNKNKAISEISLHASQACQLIISGDFGSKTFDVKQGVCVIKSNLISREFTLQIIMQNANTKVSDMLIKYRIMEG